MHGYHVLALLEEDDEADKIVEEKQYPHAISCRTGLPWGSRWQVKCMVPQHETAARHSSPSHNHGPHPPVADGT